MPALEKAARELEAAKFPIFGAACCDNKAEKVCSTECGTDKEGSFLAGSRWLTKENPDEEFLAAFRDAKPNASEVEGVKKEFNNYFLGGWDPTPGQMLQTLELKQASRYDWVLLSHSRRIIMAEVCLARDPWERFKSAIKCMNPHDLYRLVEQELDPDLRYYQDVKRLADQGNLKEHIRQLETQLARQSRYYVDKFKSEILSKKNDNSGCTSSSYQALEMKRQLLLDKLRKQSEMLGLLEYHGIRAHEVGASQAWTARRKASAAVKLSTAERELGNILKTHQKRAERLGCFLYETEAIAREVLHLLTGRRYSKTEQLTVDMAKAAPCLKDDGPYNPCSGICPFLPDMSKLFNFVKREPVLDIETQEDDGERGKLKDSEDSKPCATARLRGGTCTGNAQIREKGGSTCVYDEGPPRGHGHPRTATKCFWSIFSPFLTLLTHIWGDSYGCKTDDDYSADGDEVVNTDKYEGSIVDRCTSRFSARQQLPARKSVTFGTTGGGLDGGEENSGLLKKPLPAHMVPAWDCFCRFVKATIWPYLEGFVEQVDNYLFPENDDPTGVFSFRSTCREAARVLPEGKPRRVCPVVVSKRGVKEASKGEQEVQFKREQETGESSGCNLLRLAAVVRAHLVKAADSTTSICPGEDSPFVHELQKSGSPAAMLTPNELARTIKKQLEQFVEQLNEIIDEAEGYKKENNQDDPESREARLRITALQIN